MASLYINIGLEKKQANFLSECSETAQEHSLTEWGSPSCTSLCEQEVSFSNDNNNCYSYETDLHKHVKRCRKSAHHKEFIHVKDFSSRHLPDGYQDNKELSELVKAQADVTCCIKVKHISQYRPEKFHSTGQPYPYYSYRGRSDLCRTGSGWVHRCWIYENGACTDEEDSLCPCETCKRSGEPQSDWAKVEIWTAAHLVYDNEEARHTQCYFFYDDPETELSECPVLDLGGEVGNDDEYDVNWVRYVTHDVALARKLQDLSQHYKSLCQSMFLKVRPDTWLADSLMHSANGGVAVGAENSFEIIDGDVEEEGNDEDYDEDDTNDSIFDDSGLLDDSGENDDHSDSSDHEYVLEYEDDTDDDIKCKQYYDSAYPLAIITSHPHGCSKMVSVGQVTKRQSEKAYREFGRYVYTTPTCPGSSGSPVYILGRGWRYTNHAHSGGAAGGGMGSHQLNMSVREWY